MKDLEKGRENIYQVLSSEQKSTETITIIKQFWDDYFFPRSLNGENVDWQADYADHMLSGLNAFRAYVEAWYDNRIATIFFSSKKSQVSKEQICSVLSGYLWDKSNPCVKKPERALSAFARICSEE